MFEQFVKERYEESKVQFTSELISGETHPVQGFTLDIHCDSNTFMFGALSLSSNLIEHFVQLFKELFEQSLFT